MEFPDKKILHIKGREIKPIFLYAIGLCLSEAKGRNGAFPSAGHQDTANGSQAVQSRGVPVSEDLAVDIL